MATVIDELIVRLGLDPSQFNRGTQAAVQQLRQFQTVAQRQATAIGTHHRSVAVSVSQFISQLNQPISLLHRALTNLATPAAQAQRGFQTLGTQARATGIAVAAGAAAGAQGMQTLQGQGQRTGSQMQATGVAGGYALRGIAGAALIALAAVKALTTAFQDLKKMSTEGFQTGLRAQAAGLPVQRLTELSQALYEHGLVPQEETQDFLGRLHQMQLRAQHGDASELNRMAPYLAQIPGFNANITADSPDIILKQMAEGMSKMRSDDAIALGNLLGMSKELSVALHDAGGNLENFARAARTTAMDPRYVAAAKEFNEHLAHMELVWEKLSQTLFVNVEPALIKIIDAFSNLNTILGALAGLIGGGIVGAIMGGPLGAIIGGIGGAALGGAVGSKIGPGGGLEIGGAPRNNPGNIRAPEGGFREFGTYEEGVQAIRQNLTSYQERHGLNTVRGIISRWAPPNENPTEQLIKNAAQRTGFAPDQPLDIHDPATMEALVKAIIVQEQGAKASTGLNLNANPVRDLTERGKAAIAEKAAEVKKDVTSDRWPAWLRYVTGAPDPQAPQKPAEAPPVGPPTPPPNPQVQGMLDSIQAGPQVASAAPVSNDNSRTVTVGDIHVHTQATSPDGIASAVRDQLQRNLFAAQLNTGLA